MNGIRLPLTPALEAYLIALIYRNTRTSCCSLAALCVGMSHDKLTRLLHTRLAWSRRLWISFACLMTGSDGYLVLDDTTWQRYAQQAEAVAWVWSSTAGKVVRGTQVVLLIWTNGRLKVPVGMRVWRSGARSKVELAAEMLAEAKGRGMSPKYVCFDSWYTAAAILNLIDRLGWKYVARLKSNRLLDATAARKRWRTRFGHATGGLRKVSHRVLVVKDPATLLRDQRDRTLTRRSQSRVPHSAADRRSLSTLEARVRLGRLKRTQSTRAGRAPHLGLFALCLTQHAARQRGQTVYAFKRALLRHAIPQHLPLLDAFRAAA
jgi:hypothetical protein